MIEDVSAGMGYRTTRYGYVRASRHWNRLTLVADLGRKPIGRQGRKKHIIRCRCSCGTVTDVDLYHLRYGDTRSCGCLRREVLAQGPLTLVTHGQTNTPLYDCWDSMRRRCHNQNDKQYKNYGGRGIRVCGAWERFEPFMAWALATGYQPGLTIERNDNDGPYSPENCSWIPKPLQERNKRTTRWLTAWGETKCLAVWVQDDERCVVGYETIRSRLNRGWEPERALGTPAS
jgi:hypothetical protein